MLAKLKKSAKIFMQRSSIGGLLICKKNALQSASRVPFSYLDKLWRKKTIDTIYEDVFGKLFILLKAFEVKGDILEFGVYQGYTASLFAKKIRQFDLRETSLYLFDSFKGLPSGKDIDKHSYEFASGTWEKGSMVSSLGMEFYLKKRLSKILGEKRIYIVKGFYEDSLEKNFKENPKLKASLIHIDCDLYTSSKYVLDFIFKNEIVQDGTIIIFDDWMTSLGNPNLGQKKAVAEILARYPFWELERYIQYGIGSTVFIAHDLRITDARNI